VGIASAVNALIESLEKKAAFGRFFFLKLGIV
jgi:hypothetical protein